MRGEVMNWLQSKTPEERKAIAAKSTAKRLANLAEKKNKKLIAQNRVDGLCDQIDELEKRLAGLQREENLRLASPKLTGGTLLSPNDIVKAAMPWGRESGVYFLVDNNDVVYVGQSVNVYARIAQHTDKRFTHYAIIPCQIELLNKLESLYIHLLRPRFNGNYATSNIKMAPMSLHDLLGA